MMWNKKCKEFKEIRDMINSGDNKGVLDGLQKICSKYANQEWDYSEDFGYLETEIEFAIDDGLYEDDDEVDYYLDELYDLCDMARVWLC